MIEKLIEKYKQQKFSSDFTKLSLEALMVNQKLDEILQDLEELKEQIYENICGYYKTVYDKEKDFTEIATGVYQCKVDEEVFYQNNRFDGKIYSLTFLGIVGVDTDE